MKNKISYAAADTIANESQVLEIRKLVSEGTSKGEASRRFGVSKATIIRLCRFESWSHVGEAL